MQTIRNLIPCWYSNVFGHQAQSTFESKCFCCGKMTQQQHLPWRTFRHLKQLKIYRDLKIRGPLKLTEKRLDLVGNNTTDFEEIRPSLSGAIHCASAHMKAHFGPRSVACRAAKKFFLQFFLQFWLISSLHISWVFFGDLRVFFNSATWPHGHC